MRVLQQTIPVSENLEGTNTNSVSRRRIWQGRTAGRNREQSASCGKGKGRWGRPGG